MLDADEAANELFVADGDGNRRVAVVDMTTGAFKRGWGAYGIPLADIRRTGRLKPAPTSAIRHSRPQQ